MALTGLSFFFLMPPMVEPFDEDEVDPLFMCRLPKWPMGGMLVLGVWGMVG